MFIHKSFSKQDIKDIIHEFGLDIENYHIYNKYQLSLKVSNYLNKDNKVDFKSNRLYDNIKDHEDLKNLLNNQNPHKLLSIKEKSKVMDFCKEVIHYCKTGYVVENTIFNSLEEILLQMEDVQKYGDIPSVRRACSLMNMCPHSNIKFEPVITYKVRLELELKKKKKVKRYNCLIRKHGLFSLSFE